MNTQQKLNFQDDVEVVRFEKTLHSKSNEYIFDTSMEFDYDDKRDSLHQSYDFLKRHGIEHMSVQSCAVCIGEGRVAEVKGITTGAKEAKHFGGGENERICPVCKGVGHYIADFYSEKLYRIKRK